jgi:hypothetical protein
VPVIIKLRLEFGSIDTNGFGPHERKVPSDFKAIPNSEKYFAPVPAPVIDTKLIGVAPGICIVKLVLNSIVK